MPSQNLILLTALSEPKSKSFKYNKVIKEAGMLPKANKPTIFQSILPNLPCAKMPAVLVMDAYSKSVPTATAPFTLKNSIKIGVINEPPPTPVKPTNKPTAKPATIYCIKSKINSAKTNAKPRNITVIDIII